MKPVVVSASLKIDIGKEASLQLATEFQLYKAGQTYLGEFFGKDVPFIKPKQVVEQKLWHVHLETDLVTRQWGKLAEREADQDRFTSDRILVYTMLGDFHLQPFLLLTLLDPGHSHMADPIFMRSLADLTERERSAYSRDPANEDWTVVK
ncbi:type II toxin-antitoxin system YafO family toxin [Pseudomonas sp. G5(2012)]|uniref:type II toxin-antitoxin system YafO family toxin n=1 Tax=Pseudomonas sp. G5(2012) TaxID=1268068 RepID=UPI000690D312|nr:type II toxin-antitoxin system YafO family toxin [Pseudomonas sp. G5(2012)]